MKPIGWIFTGAVAAGATYVTLTTDNDLLAIISGVVGVFSWLLFAYFSLGVTIYDANGAAQTDRYPAMAAWGVMMAVPNIYVALTGPLHLVGDRERLREEARL